MKQGVIPDDFTAPFWSAANESKLVIDVKDKAIIGKYKGLTYKLVKDTWPDLLPDQTEWKQDTPEE